MGVFITRSAGDIVREKKGFVRGVKVDLAPSDSQKNHYLHFM